MYEEILITQLNDFVFCPASIYFHMLYGESNRILYQSDKQIDGTAAHNTIDTNTYSSKKNIYTGIDVYCEKYGLVGKIDMYDADKKILVERKKKVKVVYDGYVFQVYAQYFALTEMGYGVERIVIHSISDNKNYTIALPEEDQVMFEKFREVINAMHEFDIRNFEQDNKEKCKNCIYEPACDRGDISC